MPHMPKLWLVDLDGVMNSDNLRHQHYPQTEAARATALGWANWHAAHLDEAVNDGMIDFLNAEHANGNGVLFVSMRLSDNRDTTTAQLLAAGLAFQPVIWMRSVDDDTPPPAARAGAVLDAIHLCAAMRQPTRIALIDDSVANVQAVHTCQHIQQQAADHGCTVMTVLYPAFKGVA